MDAAAQCATCGAPMAADQRYCLQCGSRGVHLPGVREGLRASTTAPSTSGAGHGPGGEQTHPALAVAGGHAGNTTSVIAGVGVLLLAMGIGVLIGRANSSSASKAAAAPQVISVATPGASTTPTTSTTTSPPPSSSSTTKKSSKASSSSSSSSGVGQTPSKPAPPSVLKNLRTGGSGQNYEQKSKNLPNVVSTG
jgi:hypothetical protein